MADTKTVGKGPAQAPAHLSASSILSLWQCPLKFRLSRIDKIKEEPSEALIGGSFTHAILEGVMLKEAEGRTLETAKEIARNLWDREWGKKAVAPAVQDRNQFRWNVWWAIENYFKMEDPTKIVPAGVEYKIKGTVAGVTIFGVIDRWHKEDGQLVISDYKTGKVPKEEWKGDKEFQVMLYVVLMEDAKKTPVRRGELLYVSAGEIVNVIPTDHMRGLAVEQVSKAWGDVKKRCESGDFPPQTSALCSYCEL